MKYAIVWVVGKELYTHSEGGQTATYSADEILQYGIPLFSGEPEDVRQTDGRVAISTEALNEFLGLQ